MKKIKENALKIIDDKNSEDNNMIGFNTEIKRIISFSNHKNIDSARKIFKKILDFQNTDGTFKFSTKTYPPINFLNAITAYLINLETDAQEKELKFLNKAIKKSVEYIERNLDIVYLLVKNHNNYFIAKENATLLHCLDELSMILNDFEYTNIADSLFMIKSKIELGFLRYIYNKESNILLKKFNPSGKYIIANPNEVVEILNLHNFERGFTKSILESFDEKEILSSPLIKNRLNYLLLLKSINKKKADEHFKKLKTTLLNFPKEVVGVDNLDLHKDIINSINKDIDANYSEISEKKTKRIAKELNNDEVIYLTLKMLNN